MEVVVEQKAELNKYYKIERGNETIYVSSLKMEITKIQQLRTSLVVEMMKEILPTEIILIILSCVKYHGNYRKYDWTDCCAWWDSLKKQVRPSKSRLITSRIYDTRWRYDLSPSKRYFRDNKLYRMVIQLIKVNKITMRYNFQIQEHSGKVNGRWVGVKTDYEDYLSPSKGGYCEFVKTLPPYTFPIAHSFYPRSYDYDAKNRCYMIRRADENTGGYEWRTTLTEMMERWDTDGYGNDTFHIDYGV